MPNSRGADVHATAMSKVTKNVNSILKNIEKLDKQANELQAYVDRIVGRVLQGTPDSRGPTTDPHEVAKVREEVQGYIDQYKQLQDEKVRLARSLYESIETQVADLEQSKAVVEQDMAALAARIAAAQTTHRGRPSGKAGGAGSISSRAGRKSGRAAAAAPSYQPVMPVAPLPVAPPVIPAHFVPYTFKYPGREPFTEYVDPNEPKYCICNQPSQGDMIGCDNPACTREWFHNICVGIQTPPEKWYCPDCRAAGERVQPKRSRRA
eukprot:jgi/Ulvmu1/11633/UM008_0037.1